MPIYFLFVVRRTKNIKKNEKKNYPLGITQIAFQIKMAPYSWIGGKPNQIIHYL